MTNSTVENDKNEGEQRVEQEVADTSHDNSDVSEAQSTKYGEILGAALWLAARSDQHRAAPLGVVADVVLHGVSTRKFRLWRQDGAPLAFVVWGNLDPEAEAKLRAGQTLTKEEMASGDQAWILTLISPFLPADTMLKDLRETEFKGRTLLTLV